jgi:hypothetical protein
MKNGELAYRTETHAVGGGEWSIEVYREDGSFLKEFVGSNGTRESADDLWAQYEEWCEEEYTIETTFVEFHAKRNSLSVSLRKINSAILSGIPIIIGYSTRNLRYGRVAENYLHIAGKPVFWPIGVADPDTVAEEIEEHALLRLGKKIKCKFAKTCNERGQMGSYWWANGTNTNRFHVKTNTLY